MTSETNNADLGDHTSTYMGFMSVIKWSIGLLAALLIAMYFGLVAGAPFLGWVIVIATAIYSVYLVLSRRT